MARKSRHPLARCKLLNRSVNIDRGIPIYDCGRALRSTARMFGLRSLKIEDLGDTLFPRLISRGLIEATRSCRTYTCYLIFPRLISRGLIEASLSARTQNWHGPHFPG